MPRIGRGPNEIMGRHREPVEVRDEGRGRNVAGTVGATEPDSGDRCQRGAVDQGLRQMRQGCFTIAAEYKIHGGVGQQPLRQGGRMMAAQNDKGIGAIGFDNLSRGQGHVFIGRE